MHNASFRSQIAGIVSDTLYITLKEFLALEGKAVKAFLFCFGLGFFVLKREEAKLGGGGESPIVQVELVKLVKYLCGLKEEPCLTCL